MYGIPCWNVKKGHGSFLTFEFGEPHIEIGKVFESASALGFKHKKRSIYVHGTWHLWIYMCDWHIFYNNREICHSESDDLIINRTCDFLNGQSLLNVEIDQNKSTIFKFEFGGLLKIIPYSDEEINDTWMLYCPDEHILSLQSNGQFKLTKSNKE